MGGRLGRDEQRREREREERERERREEKKEDTNGFKEITKNEEVHDRLSHTNIKDWVHDRLSHTNIKDWIHDKECTRPT